MGGRGKSSGINRQIDINSYQHKLEIQDIMHNANIARESLNCIGKKSLTTNLYKKCYCCEEYTIPINSSHKKCDICGWIDDNYQNTHPNSYSGPNKLSLHEAKIKFY